jgi:HD-GYP domain-containing protein (c-di-GMP phosphodiesterase class II)
MTKLARILLVESDDEARRNLLWHFERAGHEVICVAELDDARRLVAEGLWPDVVVSGDRNRSEDEVLRMLVPDAVHLRIVTDPPEPVRDEDHESPGSCPDDPNAILERIEEVLLGHHPLPDHDEGSRCMDLARRLAASLPQTPSAEGRIELVSEGFDSFFGVTGTLVIRRGPGPDDWIEVRQGVDRGVAVRVSEEIGRRTMQRGLRPFLTTMELDGETHHIACLCVQVGEVETDLALALQSAPVDPRHREALMNLVGSAIRSAMTEEALAGTRAHLDAQVSSTESLLTMSREFTGVAHRGQLCQAILQALHRELEMTRSAVFLPREEGKGMFDLEATLGFPAIALERIGLSGFHGVGAESVTSDGVRSLSSFAPEGAAARELQLLGEAGLRWAVPLVLGSRPLGLLFFGAPHDATELGTTDRQILRSLREAASVALRNLGRVESLRDVAIRTVKGLLATVDLRFPEDRGHSERVARYAVRVGRAMGLDAGELRDLAFCALLHDVGKVVGSLGNGSNGDGDDEERARRAHPVVGSRILSRAKPATAVIQAVEQHHERWDGLGFPYGLRAGGIHLFARMLSIADAYDRMLHSGPEPVEAEDAMRRLERGAGLLWDPGLVATFSGEIGRSPASSEEAEGDAWLEEILAAP